MSDNLTDILGSAFATYSGDRVRPGVVCIAVVPYVQQRFFTIRPLNPDPASPGHQQYEIVERNAATLAGGGQEDFNFPCKDLDLATDEDLVLTKVKRRPVVVVSPATTDEQMADSSRFQDSFWCVPSYTLVDDFGRSDFGQEVIDDVMALTYRACFPLPYDPFIHDRYAMLRLDRIQPVPRPLLDVTERRLTRTWTRFLQEWVRFYVTKRLGDDDSDKNPDSVASVLNAARALCMEALAKQRAKASETGE